MRARRRTLIGMRILVVGAGAQGVPAVAIVARQPAVQRVLLASSKKEEAERIVTRLGNRKVSAAGADARDADGLVALVRRELGGVDAVLDLTPSFCSLPVMKAAAQLRAHYVNTAACPEHLAQFIARQPLDQADAFVAVGRTALLSCGASPGVVNVLCRRHCDELDTVERIEIRTGFHSPSQRSAIKTWQPTWSPEQQYFDYGDPPCLFHDGRHEHMPPFHEPETYDFGGNLGPIDLTHHAHDEQYTLPLSIGKGIRYCCYKYPFEPAVATLMQTGFTADRTVQVDGVSVRAVDVLMQLLPRPAQIAVLDAAVQQTLVPLIADTRAHIRIDGTVGGQPRRLDISSGAFCDQAGKALELFGTANVAVAYAAVTGLLQVVAGGVAPGIVWPEQLDPERFVAIANTLGLTLASEVRRTAVGAVAV